MSIYLTLAINRALELTGDLRRAWPRDPDAQDVLRELTRIAYASTSTEVEDAATVESIDGYDWLAIFARWDDGDFPGWRYVTGKETIFVTEVSAVLRLARLATGPQEPQEPTTATEPVTELHARIQSILAQLDGQPVRVVASVIRAVLAEIGDTSTVADVCGTTAQLTDISASTLRKHYADPFGGIATPEKLRAYQREAERLTSAIVATLDR